MPKPYGAEPNAKAKCRVNSLNFINNLFYFIVNLFSCCFVWGPILYSSLERFSRIFRSGLLGPWKTCRGPSWSQKPIWKLPATSSSVCASHLKIWTLRKNTMTTEVSSIRYWRPTTVVFCKYNAKKVISRSIKVFYAISEGQWLSESHRYPVKKRHLL